MAGQGNPTHPPRRRAAGVLAVALAAVLLAALAPIARGEGTTTQLLARDVPWEGVSFEIVEETDPTPETTTTTGIGGLLLPDEEADGTTTSTVAPVRTVRYHVTRIEAGAPVRFKPVVAADRIGEGREVVSSMCRRTGAISCVNMNYPVCPNCVVPHGAVVRKRQLLRSPTDHQFQVVERSNRFRVGAVRFEAAIRSAVPGPNQQLQIEHINSGPRRDQVVLHNRHFGATTLAAPGTYELIVESPGDIWVGSQRKPAAMVRVHTEGRAPIPANGFVLTGVGAGADRLWAFTEANLFQPLELAVETPSDIDNAFSGHPYLLVDGVRQDLDPRDGKVVNRHPRTVLGWDDAGTVWLVVIDGRQSHSRGMDLYDTTDLMARLGATTAVNMDGGGSSAAVTWCHEIGTQCVRNRPSDGRERPVWVGLAVVPPDRY